MAAHPSNTRFKSFYHSLSGKFIIASVLVGIVLILSTVATQFYINRSSFGATVALEKRLSKLNQIRVIMDNIWDISYFLEEHSIAPSGIVRDLIFNKMDVSISKLLFLIRLEDGNDSAQKSLQRIASDLQKLGASINHLLEIRSNPTRLYPAIQLSRSSMFDEQNLFLQNINLSIDEAISTTREKNNSDILILLMELRYKWRQLTALYRMYLINRLALLDKDNLVTQVENIELYVQGINSAFLLLTEHEKNGKLEFQASDALPKLKKASGIWVKSFRVVAATSTHEEWRADFPIIKTKIVPLMKSIQKSTHEYNNNIEQDVKKSLLDLSKVANNTSYILIALSIVGIAVLVALFYFIQNTILKPISLISAAMRREAQDDRYLKPLFIEGRSQETEDLIDAFSIMQLQVHSRKSDLEYQNVHDALTNLPNRLLLFDRMQQAISQAKRNKTSLVLIMMDLDRFKEVNDTLGHHAGDVLLQKVSKRMVDNLRQLDTVARLGGDEFAVLIPDCDAGQAVDVAMKIRECMQPAIQINDSSLYIRGSLGIAVYPEHGTDPETLLKNADISMYVSKRNGSLYEIYSYEQDFHSVNKLELKYKLQEAIENNELELYYQPQIDCQSQEIVGAEALLRWNDRDGSVIMPDVFIPLAEESGLIKGLTEWVIVAAIEQQSIWQKEGVNIHLSLNLSARNLRDTGLDNFILIQCENQGLNSASISFEMTESAMMEDTEQTLVMMKSLNDNGFNLIVDDYGTGFSSLAYLKKFPIKELKIDKSFVINMIENDEDAMIVKSTIDLAHNLGLKVIAEGVETKEVLEMLNILRCDMAQGYYVAKPMPAAELSVWCSAY